MHARAFVCIHNEFFLDSLRYYCEWVEGLFHRRSTGKLFLLQGPEFIFPVESRKRSWNEKMFTRTGSSYVTGILLPLQLWYCCSLLLLIP